MNLEKIVSKLKACQLPTELQIFQLIEYVEEIVLEEPNLVIVQAPVTICGDIHGQFHDLIKLFELCGSVPDTNYIFLGDFVDRGYHSVETILLLLVFKAMHPDRITLLRGNHESRQCTRVFGFYDECLKKFGSSAVYRAMTDLFDFFTITALVERKVLCVHGGLSPSIELLVSLQVIDRNQEIPSEGPMTDLLWSDPSDMIKEWGVNSRGAGYIFGEEPVKKFNHNNGVELICRAHQLAMDGIDYKFEKKLVTVWSAPNYCYRCGNMAATLTRNVSYENKEVETSFLIE